MTSHNSVTYGKIETTVTDINSTAEFKEKIRFCGNDESKIAIYEKCNVEHVILPIKDN